MIYVPAFTIDQGPIDRTFDLFLGAVIENDDVIELRQLITDEGAILCVHQ